MNNCRTVILLYLESLSVAEFLLMDVAWAAALAAVLACRPGREDGCVTSVDTTFGFVFGPMRGS